MTDAPSDSAVQALVELFYADLRRVAHHERLRGGRPSETMRTTALVNEA